MFLPISPIPPRGMIWSVLVLVLALAVPAFVLPDLALVVGVVIILLGRRGISRAAAEPRGRTVDDIMTDEATRKQFTQEVAAWAKEYQAPSFTRDVKTLLKLKSFLNAKLP